MGVYLSINIRRRDPSPVNSHPPGIWAQALHDYDRPEYFRADLNRSVPRSLFDPRDKLKDDSGYPEMIPLSPRVGVKLSKALQWFWVKQLVYAKFRIEIKEREIGDIRIPIERDFELKLSPAQREYIKEAWRGLTKGHTALTNGAGTDTRADFINRLRMSNQPGDLPILWELTSGGSLLKLHSRESYGTGYKVLTLSLNRFQEWKDWIYIDHPGFFSFATNSTPFGFDGELSRLGPWRVDNFHYLGGIPVPVPLISDLGFLYIRKDRVRLLEPGEPFPPRHTNP